MDPDFAQRRRVFVAVAVTAVAVPAAFLLGNGGSTASPTPSTNWSPVVSSPAAAAGAAELAAPAATEPPTSSSAHDDSISRVLGTTPGGWAGGTVAASADDPPMIAVPRPRDTQTGLASFSPDIDRTTTCIIPSVPMGTEVTITNLDNSFKVKCQVVAVAARQLTEVTMHVDAFAQIADITEAPVPVEISW